MISFPTVQDPVMQGMMDSQNLMKAIMGNLATGQTMGSTIAATNATNNAQAQTAIPMAMAGLTNAQVQAKYADPTARAALAKAQLLAKFPLLGMSDATAQQIGTAQYLRSLASGNGASAAPVNNPMVVSPSVQTSASPSMVPDNTGNSTGFSWNNGVPSVNMIPNESSSLPISNPNAPVSPISALANTSSNQTVPQTIQAQLAAGKFPSNADLANVALNGLAASQDKNSALAGYYNTRTQGYNWYELPQDFRSQQLAVAAGMGIGPQEANTRFANGETLQQMAQKQGVDLGEIQPVYPTTKTALTQIQRRQQSLAEINTLNPTLSAAVAPYSARFNGLSPKLIAQQLNNEDPDAQARYLAASALMPEMSALRARAMGANVGVEAIRDITGASMNNIKNYQPLIKPEVYQAAQDYVDQWLNDAVTKANQVGLKPELANKQNESVKTGNQTVTQAQIQDYANRTGKSVTDVTAALQAKGYTVNG